MFSSHLFGKEKDKMCFRQSHPTLTLVLIPFRNSACHFSWLLHGHIPSRNCIQLLISSQYRLGSIRYPYRAPPHPPLLRLPTPFYHVRKRHQPRGCGSRQSHNKWLGSGQDVPGLRPSGRVCGEVGEFFGYGDCYLRAFG